MYNILKFNKIFCLIATILLLSQNGCSVDQNEQVTSIEKAGDSFLEKNEIQKAINEYTKAIKTDKNNSRLYKSRAFAYFLMGDYDQAIYDDKIALSFDPNNPYIHGSIGLEFMSKNDLKSAIYHLSNGINLTDNNSNRDSMLYWNRGIAYERLGECQNAIDDYTKSLDSAPEYSHPTIKVRIAWIFATCPDKNIRNGTKALEMATTEKVTEMSHFDYRNLAAAYAETGNYKEAVKNQELAIKLLKQSKEEYVPNQEENKRNLTDYAKQLLAYKNNKPWRLSNQIDN